MTVPKPSPSVPGRTLAWYCVVVGSLIPARKGEGLIPSGGPFGSIPTKWASGDGLVNACPRLSPPVPICRMLPSAPNACLMLPAPDVGGWNRLKTPKGRSVDVRKCCKGSRTVGDRP